MIDLQDPATQVKLAKSNNGKGPTPSFAECLYGASNGGADPITMDTFIEHCDLRHRTFALSHLFPLGRTASGGTLAPEPPRATRSQTS